MSPLSGISRTVIALGIASFFTDLSSEMIYPLLPAFVAGVLGAQAIALGAIEGVAESTAALLKAVSGWLSDHMKRRKPLIVSGYALAGLARPLIGLATAWVAVLALRFVDRIGKGLRTSPRDALIADVTPEEHRGVAYGLHRAFDHAGAVVGPLVAALLLKGLGFSLRDVFLLAALPAVVVLFVLVFLVKEPERGAEARAALSPREFPRAFRELGPGYRRLLVAVGLFTLGNAADVLILLRLQSAGLEAAWISVLWSLHHVVKMTATFGGGWLADRVGRREMLMAGWALFALVFLALGLASSVWVLVAIFLVYGLYFGLTEPAERALVAGLVPAERRGAAFGVFHGVIGLAALPANLLFGVLYEQVSPLVAFSTAAGFALLGTLALFSVRASDAADTEAR